LVLILASLYRWRLGPQSLQQKLRQGLDQAFRMVGWRLTIVTIEIQNELGSTAIKAPLHAPSPSAWKDGILRLASDSFRASRGRQQTR
jgi:hypothetical protein